MMTFDQISAAYAAYLSTREVQDAMEWRERKEAEHERRNTGKAGRDQPDAGRKG
ncbi:MAG: hypothetical protein K6G81_05335 [Lachnospiraceae bacterium]|nr:hypothetical protein [Lachnospiraceae bacterium]